MRRPLQELPLDHFLVAVPDGKQGRNNKRPLSPGETPIISSAKRRNLAGQDCFSRERSMFKSPSSTLRKSVVSPSRFGDVLAGPESPARILDFGLPKHLAGDPEKPSASEEDATPTRPQPSSSRLAPSPELRPQVVRTRHVADDDVFSDAPVSRSRSSNGSSSNSYTLIPRDLPPRPDPYSIHYPGFVVYQDPHLVAFSSRPSGVEESLEDDGESSKENTHSAVNKNLTTPRGSSHFKAVLNGIAPPKFKPAPITRINPPISSLGSTSNTMSVEEMKHSRRMLHDELDLEEDCRSHDH